MHTFMYAVTLVLGTLLAFPAAAQQNIRLNTDAAGRYQENPALAVDSGGRIFVVWSDQRAGGPQIYYTQSTDGGRTWATERRISSAEARPADGLEMGPYIAAIGGGAVVNWSDVRRSPSWSIIDICAAHSADGVSFMGDPRINDSSYLAQHQPSIAAAEGVVYAAWHGFPAPRQPQPTPLFVARSTDSGATFEPQRRADVYPPGIPASEIGSCNCCRPAVFASGNMAYVAFRTDSTNFRDIQLARSADRGVTWEPVVRVSRGLWSLTACPSSGPAGAARNDTVVVAWMEQRDPGGPRSVFVARSLDGGRTFDNETRVDDEANLPSIAIDARGRIFVAWNAVKSPASVYASVSEDGGLTFSPKRRIDAGMPRKVNRSVQCAAAPNGDVYAVWHETQRDDGDILFSNVTELFRSSSGIVTPQRDQHSAIRPNPARVHEAIEITANTKAESLIVVDALGRTLAAVEPGAQHCRVTVDHPGVIFVVTRTNGVIQTTPLLVR